MPPQPIRRPKETWTSNIVITIKYAGHKATTFFSKYTNASYAQLLDDLTFLGFPHPKRANIVFKSHGILEFFWPIEPFDQSPFVQNLIRRVNPPQEGELKENQKKWRQKLSIVSLTIREEENYDSNINYPLGLPQAPLPVGKVANMSQKQQAQNPTLPVKPSNDRFHPYPRPNAPMTGNKNSPSAKNQGHQVSQPRPPFPARTTFIPKPVQEATEVFLDEIKASLEHSINPKIEPVEPTLPLSPSLPFKQGQSPATPGKKPPPQSLGKSVPSSILPLKNAMSILGHSPQLGFPVPPTSGNLTRAEADIPGLSNPSRVPSTDTAPRTENPPGSQTFEAQIPTLKTIPLVRPPVPPAQAGTSSQKPVLTTHSDERLPIQRLTEGNIGFGRTVTSAVPSQPWSVPELRPSTLKHTKPGLMVASLDDIHKMQKSLAELEKQLKTQNEKNSELIEQLQAERNRRLEMEAIVEDVERECKAPFIVPALLQAFVKISHATTAAIHHGSEPSLGANAS